jgi:ribonuclease-3
MNPSPAEITAFAHVLQIEETPILLQALTHSSFVNEQPVRGMPHNERLEFLGDALLSVAIGLLLMEQFPEANEGHLSRQRAALVDEPSLAEAAHRIGLGAVLRLGRGEELSGGRQRASLLADAFEALLAAIYLSEGFDRTLAFVRTHFGDVLRESDSQSLRKDAKTRLQNFTQQHHAKTPTYELLSSQGPEHAKIFSVGVKLDGEVLAEGEGRSKKEAEQRAAEAALKMFEYQERGWQVIRDSEDPG